MNEIVGTVFPAAVRGVNAKWIPKFKTYDFKI
jgi:hypothetical protein